MPDRPDQTLPTDPARPKKDRPDHHKPGTGEGEFPVHPDRPNLPDDAPKPDQGLPDAPKPDQGLPGRPGSPAHPAPPIVEPERPGRPEPKR